MSLELETREKFKFYEVKPEKKKKIINKLKKILEERREILLAVIYGSFLQNYPFRDIDIALYVNQEEDLLNYKFTLEKELSEKIGYPVDVRILNNAPAWFTLEVFENGEILIDTLGNAEKIYKKALNEITKLEKHKFE